MASRIPALPQSAIASRPTPDRARPFTANRPQYQILSANQSFLTTQRGGFNRIGRRSVSCHLLDVNAVEDRRTLFPLLSGYASRLPPHRAFLQNFESMRSRMFIFWRIR
jgi:hypothetical protein